MRRRDPAAPAVPPPAPPQRAPASLRPALLLHILLEARVVGKEEWRISKRICEQREWMVRGGSFPACALTWLTPLLSQAHFSEGHCSHCGRAVPPSRRAEIAAFLRAARP